MFLLSVLLSVGFMLLNECLLNNVSVVLFIYIITDVSRDDVMRVSRADVKRSL